VSNGQSVFYRIDFNQVKDADEIDGGIRALIDTFTFKGGK
jgi:hypothetical protein